MEICDGQGLPVPADSVAAALAYLSDETADIVISYIGTPIDMMALVRKISKHSRELLGKDIG